MRVFVGFAAIAFAATGCTQLQYIDEIYGGVAPESFAYAGKTWKIQDKPSHGRMMISPSTADALRAGAIEGLTLGLSGNASGSEGVFHGVAVAFLADKNGKCKVSNGALIADPQWEFFYSC